MYIISNKVSDEMFRGAKKEGKGMSNLDKQDKLEEQRFWDSQSVDARSINFEKNVYSAFNVQEYVRMFQIAATNLELPENAVCKCRNARKCSYALYL